MSADILIRDDTLGSAVEGLAVVTAELEGAERFASDLADAVGDATLSETVRGFAEKWEKKRREMLDDATAVHETLAAIAETFESADAELTAAITEADGALSADPSLRLAR